MSKNGGWADYMRAHDIPAEGFSKPIMAFDEPAEPDDSDCRRELEKERNELHND